MLKPKSKAKHHKPTRPASNPGDCESVEYEEIHFETPIGAGSFGAVWKGTCRGDVVAIKQCKVGDRHDADMLMMEIGYLQKLRHPRLVSFLGCCNRPPHVILLIEYMSGGSLYALLFKQKREVELTFGNKAKMALQIVEGLTYLHNLSIVHRDLKTMNIVLDTDLNCKICDFGLTVTLERTHLTVKTLQGSPRYMAPEQFESSAKITEKVDIWQMGCVMLELFCLSVPFSNASGVQQIATDLLLKKRAPPVPHEADPRARTLIQHCMKLHPNMRPSAAQLVEAFEGLCQRCTDLEIDQPQAW
jgi:serine/threonine protein kinase